MEPNGINIEQYLGVWAMHQPLMLEFADHVRTMDLAAHIAAYQAAHRNEEPVPAGRYELLEGGIAMVDLVGTMTKYGSSFSQLPNGTVGVRKAIRNAVNDQQVKAIVLRIDSPGGNFSGTSDLADDVHDATKKKPITAYIEDLGASAAYFVASQATTVVANPSAIVGSIGTYGVVADYSGMAARDGVKVHVVKAGKFKGIGVGGTEVTPEQLAELQRMVDQVNSVFTAAVARGRKMTAEQVDELADGRVHVAAEAQKMKLIDGVQTLDQAIESLRSTGAGRSDKQVNLKTEATMPEDKKTEQPAEPVSATLTELKAAFPASTADWREQCQEQGLTLVQCKDAWIKTLEAQTTEVGKKLAEQTAKLAEVEKQAAAKVQGNEALTTATTQAVDGSDAIQAWNKAVDEKVANGLPRHLAAAAVGREKPEIREAYVAAVNANRRK